MNAPTLLKVILGDNSSQRMTFQNGLPGSVNELVSEVQRQCGLDYDFRLQFMDALFGNDFMNLTSMDEVQDRGTIRVIAMTDSSTPQCANILPTSAAHHSLNESSSLSSGCVDTDILSSPESESSGSRSSWPSIFRVPQFSYDAELKLAQGNAAYREKGTLFIPDPKLKSNILEGLVQEIVKYKLYVSDKDFNTVGEALISKHPCLTEKGSLSGYAGWKCSLKNKLAIYRTNLRKLGCPEVTINSLKHKPEGKSSPAFGIKKPRRSEVNYCPPYPTGESEKSLESVRMELLSDVKKKNNREAVRMKMEKTFAYRRQEVVRDTPMIRDFQTRWPALFEVGEINAEFKRITTMPLQSRFLSQLDVHSEKLLKMFKNRGGQIGRRLGGIIAPMDEDDDVDLGRECVIKALCVYLNEDPENLLREYVAADESLLQESIEETTMGIYVWKHRDDSEKPEDIGIVLESQIVMQDMDSVPLAAAMLFGLIYSLNLNYPAELKYTFEVLQKVVMELEGNALSKKAQVLKNRLYQ
ncbi:uncharacterized protein LOC127364511 [Dicentrarchus labrax]|uniref:Sterile alpha motif domain-containing protein 3 n=3 Tax=Dicentrarchus labrax TaxID=13489 RepID=A0A8P4FZ31_DICLA|nr:uncharacterized protein LOC127364511 [Dicentrarchus labrax]XP_051258075.1 uncharacterized protein LOC127364511 [Dicentrarchus labrax]XP_051258076.1 uncharacterized protein LOC127364511 [Dicentrarchus labrax]XP_051258077.1 uncharacterized protein LOC127364511 [Dicentrarchus labrax]XP_051258078.1 uncharacterized protein LOC127364511 [Dicentrarchus labrax]XP_051258079.1 uncharacterized protein LOC127364511 [Dicentrarchus labrax]XP_051258080.1 uncharacterized protein LOC127364511 [Dicentrarchu